MNSYVTIIDFGTKNLKIGVFDQRNKIVFSMKQKINGNLEKSLNTLIREAEKSLSMHIDDVVVLVDSPSFFSLDVSIKKIFDQSTSIKKVYNNLIDEANYYVAQNNFKYQSIHLIVNNIIVDENIKLDKIKDDIKIKSLILELKFICLNRSIVDDIIKEFKINNLKILNLFCSSYIKSISYKNKFVDNQNKIFLDIGFERTTCLIFKNNRFDFFKSLPLGGNNITKDISKILNLDLDYSESLKIKFNTLENNIYKDKTKYKETNPNIEIYEKNISINLLRQIIESRIDEIIELVLIKNYNMKNFNTRLMPELIISGGGSNLLSNNCNLTIKKLVNKSISLNENDSFICEAGFEYNNSQESSIMKTKKKVKKYGFFENFFNLFSK